MKSTSIVAFAVSVISAGVIASPAPASATSPQNYPGFMCSPVVINDGVVFTSTTAPTDTVIASGQTTNPSTSQDLALFCPLVSNGSAISSAGIWFYSNGNNTVPYIAGTVSVDAFLCNINAGGGGGTCGFPSVYGGGNGSSSLALDTSSYSNSAFNFIEVRLGKSENGSDNVLFGYQTVLGGS